MTENAVPLVPTSLRLLVRIELRRAFRSPYEAPLVVAVNGALMAGAWLLLPTHARDALFRLHGPFAFPMVLAAWMYADVPATNVLATDAKRSLEVLDDPRGLRRLLAARAAVLWLLVSPLCVVVALGIGLYEGRWTTTGLSIVEILIVPFGALGVAAWLGVRFPYHPIPLANRWRRRRSVRHMLLRWISLIVIPYGLVPALSVAISLPAFAIWAGAAHGLSQPLTDARLAVCTLVSVTLSIVVFLAGQRVSVRIAHKHQAALADYLADPSRG
ncbi:MAG: hypothetical protein ACLPVY_27635 [Acidimicrobiia bacterium]